LPVEEVNPAGVEAAVPDFPARRRFDHFGIEFQRVAGERKSERRSFDRLTKLLLIDKDLRRINPS
jgi:hypothetical protein